MVSVDTTRLLVLGVTRLFEPANGYQLRRELLSWQVDSWANVQPGSIYSMLTTLTSQGLLERFDLEPTSGTRPVAVYRTTTAGRAELTRLVAALLTTVRVLEQTGMYAALSLGASMLTRAEALRLLDERRAALDLAIAKGTLQQSQSREDGYSPPHVAPMMGLPVALQRAERDWLSGFIDSARAGEMLFADDDWQRWQPRRDDPGLRMAAEREQYQRRLPPGA